MISFFDRDSAVICFPINVVTEVIFITDNPDLISLRLAINVERGSREKSARKECLSDERMFL